MFNETSICFAGGDGLKIKGLYAENTGKRAAVITHPHPLMGGDMWNNVVEAMTMAFYESGFSTLRFNFRGVGESEGFYDKGIGEQKNLLGASNFLREKEKEKIAAGGYSFGAWVISKLLAVEKPFSKVIFVSPPVGLLDFDFSALKDKIDLIICGNCDPFCPPDEIKRMSERSNARLEIISGTDHFYLGRESLLESHLKRYLCV